jgi:hypothetical protein
MAIIIEKQSVVVPGRFERCFYPWTFFYILGGELVSLVYAMGKSADIEGAVMISDAAGPRTFFKGTFSIFRVKGINIIEDIICIINNAPVCQICRFHYGNTPTNVHCGTAHKIIIPHTNYLQVRHNSLYNEVTGDS